MPRLMHGDRLASNRAVAQTDVVELARTLVTIELEASDCRPGELLAFDVMVEDIGHTGRWARLTTSRGKVWWTHNVEDETDGCDGEEARIILALRRTVPVTEKVIRRAELVRAARGTKSVLGRSSLVQGNSMARANGKPK
jgi:hypothetical protein